MEYVFISLIIFLTMFDVTLNTKELKTCYRPLVRNFLEVLPLLLSEFKRSN